MSNAFSAPHPAVSGARTRALNLRAIDQLGIKRLFSDVEAARAELRRWGG